MAVAGEPLVRLAELPVQPEPPRAGDRAGDQQCPRAIRARDHRVPVQGGTEARGPRPERVIAGRAAVGVAAAQHDGHEPPGVIMERPVVIGLDPAVQPQRPDPGLDLPADDVRAFGEAESLSPGDAQYRGMDSTHRPLRNLRSALLLSYPGSPEAAVSGRLPILHKRELALFRCAGRLSCSQGPHYSPRLQLSKGSAEGGVVAWPCLPRSA